MGRVILVCRLAARGLRRRPGEAALLLLAIMAATATLTLGLVLRDVTIDPYQSTRSATAGPDVVAGLAPGGFQAGVPAEIARLEALIDAPGVVGHSGPFPVTVAELEANGRTVAAHAVGRDTASAPIDQPAVTEGTWVADGGVVVEAAFADALDLATGEDITLDGRSFRVVGVAVTAAAPPYAGPSCYAGVCAPDAGMVWLTEADVRRLARPDALAYALNLRLADPTAAPAFVDAHTNHPPEPAAMSWQGIVDAADNLVRNQRRALLTGGWLLGVLAVASVAVLVGGRLADQRSRVGLLKALGGTPGFVAAVLLAECAVVAVLAAVGGLALGWLAAPLLTEPGAGLLGRADAPALTASTIGLVVAVALGVAAAATIAPAARAARTSTVLALADSARQPRRAARLIAISSRLPAPLLVGLRVAARRPRRVVLGVISVAVTVSGIVAALAARADLQTQRVGGSSGVESSRTDRMSQVLLMITVMLVALAAVNAIVITWATVLDARHASALTRALGATPNQISAGLSVAQVLPAIAGAVIGIPAGIGLFAAVDADVEALPPLWQLLAVVPATALVMTALTAIPARVGARHPVTDTLQAELV